MAVNLLTPQQVSEQLAIPASQVRRLRIERIRIGNGRGQLRYRQEDVDKYIRERIESPLITEGEQHAQDTLAKRQGRVRFHGLTPRRTAKDGKSK